MYLIHTIQVDKQCYTYFPVCHIDTVHWTQSLVIQKAGFPPALENLEKWDNFFQSGKSQGILKKCQKSGNFKWVREKSGKTVIHKLKFNQLRIKI